MAAFNPADPHAEQPVLYSGQKPENASAAVVMIHGRGAGAKDILSLATEFENADKFVFAAPQAYGNTWYPYSFLAERKLNEPGITSGLNKIKSIIASLNGKGIPSEKIMLLGFSQGACLTLEFAARNPQKYGGIAGLSGGLIGEEIRLDSYSGSLFNTPLFLGCSNIDPHIPLERIEESVTIFDKLQAQTTKKIYTDMGHSINSDEISHINKIISNL